MDGLMKVAETVITNNIEILSLMLLAAGLILIGVFAGWLLFYPQVRRLERIGAKWYHEAQKYRREKYSWRDSCLMWKKRAIERGWIPASEQKQWRSS